MPSTSMTFNNYVFLLLVGISLQTVSSQLMHPVTNPNPTGDGGVVLTSGLTLQEVTGVVEESVVEEEDQDDAMAMVNDVESVEDFMRLLKINGRPVTTNDIYDDLTDEDGKEVISGGGRLAVPDNCSPRNTTIRITMDETDSDTTFFPRCTKIERCGGCCSSPNLECQPLYTERVSLRVLKGRIPFPGAPHLEYDGFAPVIVDRHVTCRVVCTLTPELCGPEKRFLQQQCTCKCRRYVPCRPPLVWDADTCRCKCPGADNCCSPGVNCGMVFNPNSCECELMNEGRMTITASGNATRNHTRVNPNQHGSRVNNARRTTTTATTTTTTTTTTTPVTARPNPCLTHTCPPLFQKMVSLRPRPRCLCRPPIRRFRG